jgi:hypothetical protein
MTRLLAVFSALLAILLLGSLAGPRHASAWWLSADFEAGGVGSLAQGSSGFHEAGRLTTFSGDIAHSGSKSAKMIWNQSASGFGEAMGVMGFPDGVRVGGQLWMRAYVYFASPWSWRASSSNECGCAIKTIRAHVRSASGSHTGYTSVITNDSGIPYVNCETCNGMQGQNVYQNGDIRFDGGRWYAVEMYVYFHPTNGVVRMWIDGVLKSQAANIATARSGDDVMDMSYWMGYWNGGCGQNQVMYMDDVALTTDTPSGRDASGNPMIGTSGASAPPSAPPPSTASVPPAPPANLRVIY